MLALALVLASGRSVAQSIGSIGQPIVDLIDALRDRGFRIVYSDELVRASLRVTLEPASGTPFEQLETILAPHGLDLERGPRDTWLIVSARRPAAGPPPPDQSLSGPAPGPPSLETVIVTASRYAIERPSALSASTIGRQTLENMPSLGHDPLRVSQMLPGVSSNRLTSAMHIRGGDLDEVLFELDGVRLYRPYHLKDFQSVFSMINPRVIDSIVVRTGGYEAGFGDRMSGVIDMTSIAPSEPRHYELGLSLLDTSVLSSGLFSNGRGSWVTALRRGNLDVIAEIGNSEIGKPQYVDFFNKLEFSPTSRSVVTAGVLSLDDKLTLNDDEEARATADYDDAYYWLTLKRSSPSGLDSTYSLASAELRSKREGRIDDADRVAGFLAESGAFDVLSLDTDWVFGVSDRLHISWGLELRAVDLDREVRSERTALVPIAADDLAGLNAPPPSARVRLDQTRRAAHMSFRIRPLDRLVAELGVRWDDQSLTNEHQLSPRINLLFDIAERTSLRAAWGEFDQAQSLEEIAVADGASNLQSAEESQQVVLGIEHRLGADTTIRIEAYAGRISRPQYRFENIFERVGLLPELLPDRFLLTPSSARTRGAELSIEGGSDPFGWWANLTHSDTDERLPAGRFERSWDEPWSVKGGGEWKGDAWTVTMNAAYRSGWPITSLGLSDGQLVAGRFNDRRLPASASLDVLASRHLPTDRGELSWYVEVSNLLDRRNECCLDYDISPGAGGGSPVLATTLDRSFGAVPNLGLRWTF